MNEHVFCDGNDNIFVQFPSGESYHGTAEIIGIAISIDTMYKKIDDRLK